VNPSKVHLLDLGMEMESINQEEGLEEVIQGLKDLTAEIDTQIKYAARREPNREPSR
jgi:hypothetical protein